MEKKTAVSLDKLPVTRLRGVGSQVAAKLEKLGIHTVQDVLFHLPLRYEDRTRVVPIGSLRAGQQAVIEGRVELTEIVFRRRRSLLCRISDGTGAITLRFFYFSNNQVEQLQRGATLRCFGEARRGPGALEIIHPEYRFISDVTQVDTPQQLTPIYPATEGVQQTKLRMLSEQALAYLDSGGLLPELLPQASLKNAEFPELAAALRYVHRPPADADMDLLATGRHPAQRRLAFEELLAQHLSLRRLRESRRIHKAFPLRRKDKLVHTFTNGLSFSLTAAQQRVIEEINQDLVGDQPMMRLVQGDVGSGKTVVAAMAALQAIEAGCQAAVMAPTELLAEQHWKNFHAWFEPLNVEVVWLSGKSTSRERRKILPLIADGTAQVIVGTHALFQADVAYKQLALVIIDEQHRFGVHQRLALQEKGAENQLLPHQLIMTATPIPRTLAMTAYADLDSSIIDELPPGRIPIDTFVMQDNRRAEVVASVARVCEAGQQAYWVCPLVEESELLQCQAAEETAVALADALPELKIGLVHGRMKPADKETTMQQFKDREIHVLVATTVVEVGVDVPNATSMIVENAERLGLAQLHQLRGRVGRGEEASSCILMYRAPLSAPARARLSVMRETNDGFEIARQDLKLRGPGEVLGTRQAGLMQMRIADLVRDADMLPLVQRVAGQSTQTDALVARWVGSAARYGAVG
ncbi:MAG: ATP-dependent DNA helicase RecG [Gammaproteobacteria bacterium]|nr:ATP-dependent DNA helicase RecG [Gammaproteobacteria bacterium]